MNDKAALIHNPVLPGFHPDPSIIRVGEDYYMATSTFEWFPGVKLHHSRDLAHWRCIGYALTRKSQLDMLGNSVSGGIWAPCLSHCDGRFYLAFTDVKNHLGGPDKSVHTFKDTHNYLVTAPSITGPWSEPTYLNSSGFDPSLFHDDDGRKWLVNMVWDHRPGRNKFGGILLQQFDEEQGRLVGPIEKIFSGTDLGCTEGPHLFKRNGYYYLITAEGGTGLDHAATLARSEQLTGPYEVSPIHPLLTSKGSDDNTLQKAGHASLVQSQFDTWYLAHLCGRPLGPNRRCILGRESALQRVVWNEQDWLELEHGGNHPRLTVVGLPATPQAVETTAEIEHFDGPELPSELNSLRVPIDDSWASLTDYPGHLRLYGRESLLSKHRQSLIARRFDALEFEASCSVEFEPDSFLQMAGLICFYDNENFVYLQLTHDEEQGKVLVLSHNDNGQYDEQLIAPASALGSDPVELRVRFKTTELSFAYRVDQQDWRSAGRPYDATKLSDEYCREGWFTGAFVGICAQDLSGRRRPADFDWFAYRRQP